MKRALALSLAVFLLAGCGGSGGSTVPSAAAPAAPARSAAGSVVISIPTSAATATKVRYPQFVSPNAQSVALSINGGADTIFDVSANSSLCSTVAGVRNCTLNFSAPAGNDTFAFLIFVGPAASGAQLASATTTQVIVAAQAFAFTVAMNAAIGTVVGNVASTNQGNCPNQPFPGSNNNHNEINESCPGSGILSIVVTDPSGAVVTGPAAYASNISITANDPALSASPATISAPGQTSTLSYNGAAFASGISTQVVFTLTVAGVAIPVPVPVQRAYLYVANSNAPFGSPPAGGGSVAVYTFGASGAAPPIRTIAGTNTGLIAPTSVLVDATGELYVLDNGIPISTAFSPFIKVFAPGANGNVAPIRQVSSIGTVSGNQACSAIAIEPTGTTLFASCGTGIYTFPVATNGSAAGANIAQLQDDSAAEHNGIAFDQNGDLYFADGGFNQIVIVPQPLPLTPGFHLIGGPSLGPPASFPSGLSPLELAVDQNGTLYAPFFYQNSTSGPLDAQAEMGIWRSGILPCTNCPPSAFLTGPPFSTHAVLGVALDPIGNVYVANAFTGQITEFSAATIAGASVGTTGAVLHALNNTGSGQSTTPLGITVGP